MNKMNTLQNDFFWENDKFYFKIVVCTYITYYVMRSKNEVLCAAAGRLAAERSAPKHIKPFLLRITYTILSSNLHNKLFKMC
jgi:hypothetical protein